MNPDHLRYSKEHEWIESAGEARRIGITRHAQDELGDIVFVELPEVGKSFAAMEVFGTVESVKAVSELYLPVAGEVVEVNGDLADHPERINEDPYEGGWLIRIRPAEPTQVDALMAAADYQKYVAGGDS